MAKKSLKGKEVRGTNRLKPQHKLFAVLYLTNGGNGTQAYNDAYGGERTPESAKTSASRLLTLDAIKAYLTQEQAKTVRKVEANADEAMQMISRALRADPALMWDEGGKLLPVNQWPADIRLVLKSIKPDGTVTFYDKLRAAELIAEAGGRIRKKLDVSLTFDHVKYLADLSRPKE